MASSMNLQMTLSLVDRASPKLKAFLEQLSAAPKAASEATSAFTQLGNALKEITEQNTQLAEAARSLRAYGRALAGVTDNAKGVDVGLENASVALAQVAVNAREAATAFKEVMASQLETARASQLMNVGVLSMTEGLAASRKEAEKSIGAFKALAVLWGAMKIDRGIKGAIHEAGKYQETQAEISVRNLPPGERRRIENEARVISRQQPYFSTREVLQAEGALLPALPGDSMYMQAMRARMLPKFLQVARVMAMFGDTSSLGNRIQNLGGVVEAMGGAENINKASWIARDLTQAIEASHGKLDVRSIETGLRNMTRGVSANMTSDAFRRYLALQEEFKAAGGGGIGGNTKAATLVNAIFSMSTGGKVIRGIADLMAQLGLIKVGDIHKYGSSTTMAWLNPGSLKNSSFAAQNPVKYALTEILPRMLAYTQQHWKRFGYKSGSQKDLTNPTEMSYAVANLTSFFTKSGLGGQSTASALAMLASPGTLAAIEAQVLQARQAATAAQAAAKQDQLWVTQVHALGNATRSFGQTLGMIFLPALTKVVKWMTHLVNLLNDFAGSHPVVAALASIGTAFTSATLAISVFLRLMGTSLTGVLRGALGVFKWFANAVRAVFTGLRLALAGWFGATIEMVASFATVLAGAFLFYEAGQNVKIFGVTLNHYIAISLLEATQQFEHFFTFVEVGMNNMASHFWNKVEKTSKSLGLSGLQRFADSQRLGANLRAASIQASMASGDKIYQDEIAYYNSVRGNKTEINKINDWTAKWLAGKPPEDAVAKQLAARAAAAHIPGGNMADLGAVPEKGKKTVAELAQGWWVQDMHRAGLEANKMYKQQEAGPLKASRALAAAQRKGATPAQIRQHWEQVRSQLASSGDPSLRALAPQAEAMGVKMELQAKLKEAKKNLSDQQTGLHDKEKLNAALVTAGVLTKDQAQRKTLADQHAAVSGPNGLLASAERVRALERQLHQSTTAIDGTIASLKALGTQLTAFQQKVSNTIEGAFSNLFSQIMKGRLTWRQMGHDFIAEILNGMNKTISQDLAQGLVKGLFQPGTGGGNALRAVTSSSALMGHVGSWFSNLFGGGTKTAALPAAAAAMAAGTSSATAGGGFWASIGGWLSKFGMSFASGIDNVPHDMVAQIHRGEMIVPQGAADMIRSGAVGGHQFNINISAMDSQSVLGAMDGVKRELAQMLGGTNQNLNLGAY